jgi:hypothetical protein
MFAQTLSLMVLMTIAVCAVPYQAELNVALRMEPAAAASRFAEPEGVTLKTEDDIQIYADVFESPQGKTAPLIFALSSR